MEFYLARKKHSRILKHTWALKPYKVEEARPKTTYCMIPFVPNARNRLRCGDSMRVSGCWGLGRG